MNKHRDQIVISIGGSLISPPGKDIADDFLKNLNDFVRKQLQLYPNRQFFLVAGGGNTAATYRTAGKKIVKHALAYDDLDWLGIHATRLNAHLLRTVFRDIAHPFVLKHYEIIRRVEEAVIIASGWKPGFSTDFCAVTICEDYKINTLINLTSVKYVFEKDPGKYFEAKPLKNLTWRKYRELIGDTKNEWIPAHHLPFDEVASHRAQELNIRVIIMKGTEFKNLENYLDNREFIGTVIEG